GRRLSHHARGRSLHRGVRRDRGDGGDRPGDADPSAVAGPRGRAARSGRVGLSNVRAGAHLRLKPGRERSLLRRHPWVFSGAIDEVAGSPQSGATARVCAADGRFLAWAAYSPASQIRARVWSFEEAEVPGPELCKRRIEAALALRQSEVPPETSNALRLVHGESDGLPGLVADRYADTL